MNTFLRKASGLLLLAASVAGCADSAYDLDKLDTRGRFGSGEITLPLGSTDKITIGDLIDDALGNSMNDLIKRNSNGTYSISYGSDPYDLSFTMPSKVDRTLGLSRYKGRYIDLEFNCLSKPSGVTYDANGVADLSKKIAASRKVATKAFRLPFTIPSMPEQLNGLSSALLTDDSAVKITLSVPNCLLTDGTITPDLKFDLHELFEVEGFPDGIITFNDLKLEKGNGFSASKVIKLTKIVVDPTKYNTTTRTLDINAHLNFTGNILFDNPKTTREQYAKAPSSNQLVVRVQLVNVLLQGIEGQFTYEVDSIRTRLKMAKVAEKFGGDDSPVLFSSPELRLTYNGNFTVPAKAKATFIAQRNGVTTAQISNVPFDLPMATGSSTVKRVYRFSSGGGSSSGMVGVKANIPALFKPVPDIIYVYLDIATDNTKTGVLELGKTYQLQVSLSVTSPLAYGPGLRLSLDDTFSLPSVLGDILKENRLKLIGDITNTSPLKIDIDFVMADEAGQPVTRTASQTIASGGTTPVELEFIPLSETSLDKLSKGVISLKAAPASSGKAVKATDYIQADLKFQLPEGYRFSF